MRGLEGSLVGDLMGWNFNDGRGDRLGFDGRGYRRDDDSRRLGKWLLEGRSGWRRCRIDGDRIDGRRDDGDGRRVRRRMRRGVRRRTLGGGRASVAAGLEVTFANHESDDEGEDYQDDTEDDPAFRVLPAHVTLELNGSSTELRSTVR